MFGFLKGNWIFSFHNYICVFLFSFSPFTTSSPLNPKSYNLPNFTFFFQLRTMTYSFVIAKQLLVPYAFHVTTHTLPGDRNYIPEQTMKKEKTVIWTSRVLIHFWISGNVHAFLCPFPRSSAKSNKLNKFSLVISTANLVHLKRNLISCVLRVHPNICSSLLLP